MKSSLHFGTLGSGRGRSWAGLALLVVLMLFLLLMAAAVATTVVVGAAVVVGVRRLAGRRKGLAAGRVIEVQSSVRPVESKFLPKGNA